MIGQLRDQHAAVCAAAGQQPADMTVVFDAGQNSEDNFGYLAETGLRYIGSVPASDCPGPDRPARQRPVSGGPGPLRRADRVRHPPRGLRRRAAGDLDPFTRVLHESQARGFTGTTLAKAGRELGELAATLAAARPAWPRQKVEAEIETITRKPWGPPGHHLAAGRRAAQGPAAHLGHRPRRPRRPGRGTVRQARADHRP